MFTIKKEKSQAYGKKTYLVGIKGKGKQVTKYWLEEPSWDSNWRINI